MGTRANDWMRDIARGGRPASVNDGEDSPVDAKLQAIGNTRREFDKQIRDLKANKDLMPEARERKIKEAQEAQSNAVSAAKQAYKDEIAAARTNLTKSVFGVGLKAGTSAGDEVAIRGAYRQALSEGASVKDGRELRKKLEAAQRAGDNNYVRGLLQAGFDAGHLDVIEEFGGDDGKQLASLERTHGERADTAAQAVNKLYW